MARYKENDCVGCEHCVNCGRRESYFVYECDVCGDETTNRDDMFEVNGKDLCVSCYEKYYGGEEDGEA